MEGLGLEGLGLEGLLGALTTLSLEELYVMSVTWRFLTSLSLSTYFEDILQIALSAASAICFKFLLRRESG